MMWCKQSLWWWVLSGVLLGIALVLPLMWVLGIVGGGVFIWRSFEDRSRLAPLGGWLAWAIKYAFANCHMLTTYPIEWLSVKVTTTAQILLIGFSWLTLSLWLGVGGLLAVIGIRVYQKQFQMLPRYWAVVILPLVWVVSEIFGSFFFSLMMLGPGGDVNTTYGVGYSGYILAEHAWLLQMARVAGVYGLSALFFVLAFIVWTLKNKPKAAVGVLLLLFVTGFVGQPTPPTIEGDFYVVRIIDTQFERNLFLGDGGKEIIHQKSSAGVAVALEDDPDYLVLPEGANFLKHEYPLSRGAQQFWSNYPNSKTILIDSGATEYRGQPVVEAAVLDPRDRSISVVDKRYLVPQGEFIPYFYSTLFSWFGSASFMSYVDNRIRLEVGPRTNQSTLPEASPGILLCFEVVAPTGVRTVLREKPQVPFVAHPISHQWFHEPVMWWHETDVMLKVQAMWNGIYITSAGNYVAGKTYAPNGAIVPMDTVVFGDGWVVKEVKIPR